MTFCLAMKVKDGLVAIADTRVTSGKECMTAKKVTVRQALGESAVFIMTSGLRSLRDKAMTYFHEVTNVWSAHDQFSGKREEDGGLCSGGAAPAGCRARQAQHQ